MELQKQVLKKMNMLIMIKLPLDHPYTKFGHIS
jgi:hypothetical protein